MFTTMKDIKKLIEKIKTELIHSGYLTGWEILHYKELLKKLESEV